MNDATTSKETCSIFAGLLSAEARRSNIRDGRRGMQSLKSVWLMTSLEKFVFASHPRRPKNTQ